VITFTVPGDPVAKGRARGGPHGHYTPKKTVSAEGVVKVFAQQAMGDLPPMDGPLSLEFEAVYLAPKSWSNRKRETTLWKETKPDGDNLHKLLADAMNQIVYLDDCQIVRWSGCKRYGTRAELRVTVKRL